jgi:enoyl-[acyl-carrier protein] reductase II
MRPRTPICDLFGIEVPIFLAGMGGVAYAEVCAAVSEAGGFGTLGMATASPQGIREQMREVRRRTSKPFGVDLLAALPEQMIGAMDVIIGEGASAFIAGLGVPEPVIDRCHEAGLKVMSMCGRVSHAVHAARAGCDVVVAQGTEAGGHTGQIAGLALIPQVVDAVDIPVLAAGGIASHEARAAESFKKRITVASADDTTVTRCYSGKPMRVLRNAYVTAFEADPSKLRPFPEQMRISAEAGVLGMAMGESDLDPERACMPTGQGCGGILDVASCAEIVERVMSEARETIDRLGRLA